MKLTIMWQAVRLFYSSVAPALLSILVLVIQLVQLPLLFQQHHASLLSLLLIKMLTASAVWYLSEQLRPHQYWLYYNLGIGRRALWGAIVALDALLFVGLMLAVNTGYGTL